MFLQIPWTRYQLITKRTEVSGHETGILGLSRPDHDIEALLDDFDQPVGEVEVELHLGPGPHETRQHGHHQHSDQREADPELPLRRGAGLRQLCLGRLDLMQDAPAPGEQQFPFGRQGNRAGGSVQQPDRKPVLKPGNGLPDGGRGQAKFLRRCGEASGLGREDEGMKRAQVFHLAPNCGHFVRYVANMKAIIALRAMDYQKGPLLKDK